MRKSRIVGSPQVGQKSILSFFSTKCGRNDKDPPSPQEPQMLNKSKEENSDANAKEPPAKKQKLLELPTAGNNGANSSDNELTAQEKRLMQENAIKAKLIRSHSKLKVLDQNMGISWFRALEAEFSKDYFEKLNDFVVAARKSATVYPPPEDVWEWTKHFSIKDVKVVILGQDPYHGPRQAHGLCFSVPKGVRPPPSLLNMYKELESDIDGFKSPDHGFLNGWAVQGVLLLNAVLTVEASKPNSHKDKGWEKITDSVISWISRNTNSVVFLLWGSYAQKKASIVDKKRHHLLQCTHPSPLSAHRGFFGCKHFSKCNDLLKKSGKKPIDWNHL